MESITVTRPVTVKVLMTDSYRKELLDQCERMAARLDMELKRLDFDMKRALAEAGPGQEYTVRHQYDAERRKRLDSKQKLAEQMQAAREVADGTELVAGRVESMVEVRVGDDWRKLAMVEILVENGRVVAIREGSPGMPSPAEEE
ncbi:MAG: YlqD family protein [Thermoanaerobacterales bacterium]|nr:YlqD family protein [Bacillota bacterium]MDI6907292.1 YlqD family protein [Thermoanaerobacterales bacterium]